MRGTPGRAARADEKPTAAHRPCRGSRSETPSFAGLASRRTSFIHAARPVACRHHRRAERSAIDAVPHYVRGSLVPFTPSAHDLTCTRSPCPRHGSICSGRSDLLSIAIDHFVERGFEVHAILPRWAMDGGRSRSEANKLLDANRFLTRYIERGQLHLAPAGVDDDDFVLSFALETAGAFILTNDLYRDHVAKDRVTRSWLDERLMAFMFVLDDISASGARRHRLLVPSHTFGQQQPPPPCPASTAMTTETLEAAGQNRPTRASSPSAESSSSTRTLVTVAPGQRVVRRLGFASSGASSPKKALAAVTKHTRTPIRCRGRQGSGPSMKELLARPKQFDRRF